MQQDVTVFHNMTRFNTHARSCEHMGETLNVSFNEDEKELYEWVVMKAEEGDFRYKSSVVIQALKEMKRKEEDEGPIV